MTLPPWDGGDNRAMVPISLYQSLGDGWRH